MLVRFISNFLITEEKIPPADFLLPNHKGMRNSRGDCLVAGNCIGACSSGEANPAQMGKPEKHTPMQLTLAIRGGRQLHWDTEDCQLLPSIDRLYGGTYARL